MAFQTISGKRFSDLVVHELDPSVGYSRQSVNVTPPAAGAAIAMGTVGVRAKSANPAAPYTVLAAAADVVATNEFVVLYGDCYGQKGDFVPFAVQTGEFNAVGFVGHNGGLQLKEYFVKQIAQDADGAALTDAEFESLRQLLNVQGISLLETK